ncbi:hypothetical protein [Burkholderia sp. TSV86]|uniref:hypothetical protein n=1 Tax=Burkholderia sp. TSV86 TaxID=1385594 RepID=UPI00075442DB|nr:hypothetical protein [Burkholderia sp. TSV86]KVE39328.1 hypothetical protein WS68_21380 [Burkholderia sp. TSV86]
MTDFESKLLLNIASAVFSFILVESRHFLSNRKNGGGLKRVRYSVWKPNIPPQKANGHAWLRSAWRRVARKPEHGAPCDQIKIFFWNSGSQPIIRDDLVKKKPLTLQLVPPAAITSVALVESAHAIGVKLTDERLFNRDKSKKIITFDRLDPGHGFVATLGFASGHEPAARISGPVLGSAGLEYAGPVWAIDLADTTRIGKQRSRAIWVRRLSGLSCAAGVAGQFIPIAGPAPLVTHSLLYWLFFAVFAISWMVFLMSNNVCEQFKKKIPPSLHYWDDSKN